MCLVTQILNMQDQDLADQEARKKKELNAVLRNFEQEEDETPDTSKEKVDAMLAEKLETTVTCVSAKRLQMGRSDAAQGIVIVQFEKKHGVQSQRQACWHHHWPG